VLCWNYLALANVSMVRRVTLSDSERLFAKSGVASPNLLRAAQNAVTEGSDCALQHVAGRA
jgi:hypothetical protein